MPAIRSQAILADGFQIETVEYGLRRIQLEELGGNQVRLTAYLDGIQVAQQTLSNPSLAEIYAWVANALFPGASVSVDGKTITVDAGLYVSWHVIQRNPLQLLLMCSNAVPDANWWQQ